MEEYEKIGLLQYTTVNVRCILVRKLKCMFYMIQFFTYYLHGLFNCNDIVMNE